MTLLLACILNREKMWGVSWESFFIIISTNVRSEIRKTFICNPPKLKWGEAFLLLRYFSFDFKSLCCCSHPSVCVSLSLFRSVLNSTAALWGAFFWSAVNDSGFGPDESTRGPYELEPAKPRLWQQCLRVGLILTTGKHPSWFWCLPKLFLLLSVLRGIWR